MAFLNGKYTAFDPQVTMVDGVVDDDENCVAHAELSSESAGAVLIFDQSDKLFEELEQALNDGKRVWVTYKIGD